MTSRLKNSLIYLLPSLVGAILPFIALPIFTRIISPKDFGVLALCQAYSIFVAGISNFGLTFGYERNFFENDDNKKKAGLLYTTLLFVSTISFIFIMLTYFFSHEISFFFFGDYKYSFLLTISYVAATFSSLKAYFLTYFKNTENAKKYVIYTLDENLMSFFFSIILVVGLNVGVTGIALAQLTSSFLVLLILCIRFLKIIPFCLNVDLLKKSLLISVPLTPRIFFGVIGSQFDKYIIGRMSSIGDVGIFSIAQKVSSIVFIFMTAIQNVWGPVVYKMMFLNEKESGKNIGNFLSPFFYLSTLMGLVISIFSEEILYFIAPKEYEAAAELITIMSILQTSLFFGKQNQLIFAKKSVLISILTLVGIFINVLISYLFIAIWGMIGVAWGMLISGLLMGGISFYFSQKSFKISFDKYKYTLIFIVYLIASLSVLFLTYFNFIYPIKILVKIFFLILFLLIGFYVGVFTKERYFSMRNLWRSKFHIQ